MQYCNPFWNARATNIEVKSPLSLILTLKLVAIATSLERSVKDSQIGNLPTVYGENVVKIGPIDPEIALLKKSLKTRNMIREHKPLPIRRIRISDFGLPDPKRT